jgi:hypothetical protein
MIEDRRLKAMSNLIDALDAYVQLIGEELNEVAGMAFVGGWRSDRVKAGNELRKRIAILREKVSKP